jgi:uncharacterized coiled-coil protein SlyX
MPKTKEQIRTEIATALQSQTINTLVEALAEANAKIEELTEKVDSCNKPDCKT